MTFVYFSERARRHSTSLWKTYFLKTNISQITTVISRQNMNIESNEKQANFEDDPKSRRVLAWVSFLFGGFTLRVATVIHKTPRECFSLFWLEKQRMSCVSLDRISGGKKERDPKIEKRLKVSVSKFCSCFWLTFKTCIHEVN